MSNSATVSTSNNSISASVSAADSVGKPTVMPAGIPAWASTSGNNAAMAVSADGLTATFTNFVAGVMSGTVRLGSLSGTWTLTVSAAAAAVLVITWGAAS